MISLNRDFKISDISLLSFVNLKKVEKKLVLNLRNNEKIRKWMYTERIISWAEHIRFLNKLKKDKENFYWLAKYKNDNYLGVIYLSRVNNKHKHAYFGIYVNPYFVLPAKGIMLIRCLKVIIFEKARFRTLKLEVLQGNKRAVDFYARCGFKIEGVLKDFVFKSREWEDVIIMGMSNKLRR